MSAVPAEEYCVKSKSTFNGSTNWRQTDEGTSRGVSWSCVVHLPEYEIGVFSLLHRVSQLQWKTKLPSNKPLQLHLPGFPLMAHTYPLERHLANTFRDLMQNKKWFKTIPKLWSSCTQPRMWALQEAPSDSCLVWLIQWPSSHIVALDSLQIKI